MILISVIAVVCSLVSGSLIARPGLLRSVLG